MKWHASCYWIYNWTEDKGIKFSSGSPDLFWVVDQVNFLDGLVFWLWYTCHPLKDALGKEEGTQPDALRLLSKHVIPSQDKCIQTFQIAHLGPCWPGLWWQHGWPHVALTIVNRLPCHKWEESGTKEPLSSNIFKHLLFLSQGEDLMDKECWMKPLGNAGDHVSAKLSERLRIDQM